MTDVDCLRAAGQLWRQRRLHRGSSGGTLSRSVALPAGHDRGGQRDAPARRDSQPAELRVSAAAVTAAPGAPSAGTAAHLRCPGPAPAGEQTGGGSH